MLLHNVLQEAEEVTIMFWQTGSRACWCAKIAGPTRETGKYGIKEGLTFFGMFKRDLIFAGLGERPESGRSPRRTECRTY